MKVAELKEKIQGLTRAKLEHLIVEMYKVIPKSVKEMKGIDSLIINPDAEHARTPAPAQRDLEDICFETEDFLSNAYNQYYFAPNSVVPKSKRSGWRFTARRLFKELKQAAENPADASTAAEFLKKLYEMLCYACRYILFSGDDSFGSVGIPQVEFFRTVLDVKRKIEPSREFVRNSILLALANDLNRDTLWEDLLEVLVAMLETADLKEVAIENCNVLRKEAATNRLKKLEPFSDGPDAYRARRFVNNLAVMGWMCHMALEQPNEAVHYFRQYYVEKNPEIALYVLLRMVEHHHRWDLWLKTYQEAVDCGVQPREALRNRSQDVRKRLGVESSPTASS